MRLITGQNDGRDGADFWLISLSTWNCTVSEWDEILQHPVDSAYWGSIEPGRDVYNWGELDSLIGAATANGVSDLIFAFGNPPTWALNPDGSVNQGDADEFVTTLVRRECGTIRYYETWNEANLPSSWTGTQTQLITLAQHFYQIVRANCPAAKVLTPSVNTLTYADSRMWLQWWL